MQSVVFKTTAKYIVNNNLAPHRFRNSPRFGGAFPYKSTPQRRDAETILELEVGLLPTYLLRSNNGPSACMRPSTPSPSQVMFIKTQQAPTVEFNPADGQSSPTLVHYFSDRAEPFKSALPVLIEGASQESERVMVVESPLSDVMDWTIEVHRHPDFPDQVVVDEKQRAFFTAAKRSLAKAMARIDRIQFVRVDDEDEGEA